MVKIKLVITGEIKDKNINELTKEYYKRLSKWCKIEEVIIPEIPPRNDGEIKVAKKKQAQFQLAKFEGFCIALDRFGKSFDSIEFAKKIKDIQVNGNSTITFLIGGSNGFDKSVLDRADLVISFSKITFPHELMKVVLVEQIYRAFTINNNIAYHK